MMMVFSVVVVMFDVAAVVVAVVFIFSVSVTVVALDVNAAAVDDLAGADIAFAIINDISWSFLKLCGGYSEANK